MVDLSPSAVPVMQRKPVAIAQAQGGRSYQEDTYTVLENDHFLLVAIFDGHGGPLVAQWARNDLASAILATATQSVDYFQSDPVVWKQNLRQVVAGFDANLCATPVANEQGSCVGVLLFHKTSDYPLVTMISLGDVEAYFYVDGKTLSSLCEKVHRVESLGARDRQLIADHTQSTFSGGYIVAPQQMKSLSDDIQSYTRHSSGDEIRMLAVSGSIGDHRFKHHSMDGYSFPVTNRAEVRTHKVHCKQQPVIILASDGLWDALRKEHVVATLQAYAQAGPQKMADFLVKVALDKMNKKADNITVAVIDTVSLFKQCR